MKTQKVLMFALSVVLAAGLCSAAAAFGPAGSKDRGPGKRIERMAKALNLTQQQKDRFLADSKKIEEEAKLIRVDNKVLYDKIRDELVKDSPDRGALHKYIEQICNNDKKLRIKRMDAMLDLKKNLTPEQREKLKSITGKRRGPGAGGSPTWEGRGGKDRGRGGFFKFW